GGAREIATLEMLHEPRQQRKGESDAEHVDVNDGKHQCDIGLARNHESAAKRLRIALAHLRGSQAFLARAEKPLMAERVGDHAGAIAVKLILRGPKYASTLLFGTRDGRVHIGD